MNITRRMIVIPVATLMAAGIGAGAFAVGLSTARGVPEAVTADTTFSVTLTGQQEFSPGGVPGAGDLDATGGASITIDTVTDEVCVDVKIANIENLILMHIHRGAAGINGPVVVDFAVGPSTPPTITKCVPGGVVADEIAANPLGFYLNAHTTTFPAGAVRGQLQPQGGSATGFGLSNTTHILPTPVRVFDSRLPNSLGTPALESNSNTTADLTPTSVVSIPPGAIAALVTVTATDVRAAGFATVYSAALTTVPGTSTINWSGHDVAITTTVKVDATGSVKITIGPTGAADIVIDVLGYLAPPEIIATPTTVTV
jgi:hypothetical protein